MWVTTFDEVKGGANNVDARQARKKQKRLDDLIKTNLNDRDKNDRRNTTTR